ncbi:hypothetical protein [Variovorax ginsengisoli]|uniref:Transposase n=1 Tax=Variovorax ginsengisoli TaxID=363844 RepID=A0ABT8S8Q3_9BURK|nr:hypothetical protein [Variovorax ginsengisoli]MDN8616106.1 hypothetical protein [Variovorax ginsengisoli]MDO1535276.1 hypothetical protein [Variovorax ginsengisoli]
MRTDIFRAFGTDGRMHIVFRRTQTFLVKTVYGPVEKRREPRFYLENGELLECADRYDTFRTLAGDLVVRIVHPNAKRGTRATKPP